MRIAWNLAIHGQGERVLALMELGTIPRAVTRERGYCGASVRDIVQATGAP